MARKTLHGTILREIRKFIKAAMVFFAVWDSDGDRNSDTDNDLSPESESDSDGEYVLVLLGNSYQTAKSLRYLKIREKLPRSMEFRYSYFSNLTDDDFRAIARLSKETFQHILELIHDHPIFQNGSLHQQAPVHWQLVVALDRLGNDGQGVSASCSKLIWGLGHGTIFLYCSRIVTTLSSLKDTYITWPDRAERAQISLHMEGKGFKGAMGFVDGTTFPLHLKPRFHGASYFDRKEYILVDSAYGTFEFLVPAYRGRQRDVLTDLDEPLKIIRCNTFLAMTRVLNEHTIGVLKSKWSSLRGLRLGIRDEGDIIKIVEWVVACVILHNIAVQRDPWDEDCTLDEGGLEENPAQGDDGHARMSARQRKRLTMRRACLLFHDSRRENEMGDNLISYVEL